jgi:hypothetical protein
MLGSVCLHLYPCSPGRFFFPFRTMLVKSSDNPHAINPQTHSNLDKGLSGKNTVIASDSHGWQLQTSTGSRVDRKYQYGHIRLLNDPDSGWTLMPVVIDNGWIKSPNVLDNCWTKNKFPHLQRCSPLGFERDRACRQRCIISYAWSTRNWPI